MQKNDLRKAIVRYHQDFAGILEETESGYRFTYDDQYIQNNKRGISFSLPIEKRIHESTDLFSFFIGLLPEGWYLNMVCSTLKIDKNNIFEILLSTCTDTPGAVSIERMESHEE